MPSTRQGARARHRIDAQRSVQPQSNHRPHLCDTHALARRAQLNGTTVRTEGERRRGVGLDRGERRAPLATGPRRRVRHRTLWRRRRGWQSHASFNALSGLQAASYARPGIYRPPRARTLPVGRSRFQVGVPGVGSGATLVTVESVGKDL